MTATRSPDVVIVGGGVIGCGIAYELAKRGAGVMVMEKDVLGSGASNASAGMLAPLSDGREPPSVRQLGALAFRMYPRFIEEIEEAAGMTVECISSGIIRTAVTEEEATVLRQAEAAAADLDLKLEWLSGEQARKLEPLIGPEVVAATFSPSEPHLNPSRLVESLRRAAVRHGAEFREHTTVTGLIRAGDTITGVRLTDEVVSANLVALAMGSWSCLAGQWLDLDVPIFPVRGQMVYVNRSDRPLRHTVIHHNAYATPKGDGTTLLGTTVEHAGFDARVTVSGITSVLGGVQRLLPSFGDATINHTRVGLRPWSKDNLPVLGPVPGINGVIIASGHYRSGILLTPITADLIARFIVGGAASADFGPHSAARLTRTGL
ncbi:MAG: thiO [Dehalococcoidia bacterium]|nr:thiO [Dehalococcoidia bacterium]